MELALYPGVVSIISDFLPSSTRVNTAFYYSKVAVPCAFFLAIILLLLAKNRKRIVEVLNRYKSSIAFKPPSGGTQIPNSNVNLSILFPVEGVIAK
jgi:hypothetical protein